MKKKKLLRRFIRVFGATFSLLLFVGIIGFATYLFINNQYDGDASRIGDIFQSDKNKNKDADQADEIEEKMGVAVYGVDRDGYRTDIVMYVNFDAKTKNIDIISVPRDTKVTLSDSMYAELSAKRSSIPKTMKINGVPAYAPADERNKYAVAVLEENLGVEVDYYVKLKVDGFRDIVDLIGGVEVNVPKDMKYDDPYQNLHINLKKGTQILDGAKAEHLIRYRKGYSDQDLGRIKMQHEFMTQFIKKILSPENRGNLITLIPAVMEYLDTNLTLPEALKYAKYIDDINLSQIAFQTIPGEASGSYFIMDKAKTLELMTEVKNKTTINGQEAVVNEEASTTGEPISSVGKKIELLNGTSISGLAAKFKTKLEADGLTISKVDNYRDSQPEKTKIIVKEKGMGSDLVKFFKDAEVEVGTLSDDIDIRIIIGSSQ